MGGDCTWACCPNCGYALAPGRKEPAAAARNLAELPPGESAEIMDLDGGMGEERVKAAISMGLVPGVRVQMVRRHPTVLVKAGLRSLALDEALAKVIILGRGAEPGKA
jgi:Fe2+ transport system protein FeoA